MNEMLGWEHHGIATWQLVDAQGQAGFGDMMFWPMTIRAASRAFCCSRISKSRH